MENPKNIRFSRAKSPGMDFEIFPLEVMMARKDLDHDPTRLHRVQFYVMLIITSGRGSHTVDFVKYDYARGSVITVRKDQLHCFEYSKAMGYIILFTEEYLLSYLDRTGSDKIASFFNELLFEQHTQLNEESLEDILHLIGSMGKEYNGIIDEHSARIIRNYLQILISNVYRIRDRPGSKRGSIKYNRSFIELHKLIEQHCPVHRNVQHYADLMNTTARTLNTVTNNVLRKSVKQLIDELVILEIKRCLINSEDSIKEIAHQFSFDEPTNLFKYFKRHAGKTPEVFRKMYMP